MADIIDDDQDAYEQIEIEHRANFLSRQQNNEWCDIQLYGNGSKVDGNVVLPPIRAHKMILAAASEHCSRAFTVQGFIESGANELMIAEIDHDILQVVVDFIYTSKLRVVGPNVLGRLKSVFIAADFLLMSELAGVCEKALLGPAYLHDNTCVAMWEFAEKYGCQDLEAEAARLVANCVRFGGHQAYTNLPAAGLIWMIKSLASRSSVDTDSLCRAVVEWIEHDPTTRKAYGNEIMQHVPLQKVTGAKLRWLFEKDVLSEDVMKLNTERLEQRLRELLEKAAQSLTTSISNVDILRSVADYDQSYGPIDRASIETDHVTAIALVREIEDYLY